MIVLVYCATCIWVNKWCETQDLETKEQNISSAATLFAARYDNDDDDDGDDGDDDYDDYDDVDDDDDSDDNDDSDGDVRLNRKGAKHERCSASQNSLLEVFVPQMILWVSSFQKSNNHHWSRSIPKVSYICWSLSYSQLSFFLCFPGSII